MTDIDETIRRVRELDAAATKGPWRVGSVESWHVFCPSVHADAMGPERVLLRMNEHFQYEHDAALIAYYRTTAPLLADEVERLRAENAARREELRLAQCPNPRDPEHGGHCETCSGLSVARTRRLSELESEVERLLAREAELEEALGPFAACSVGLDDPDAEGDIDWAEESLTLADVRTARAALAKGGEL